MSGNELPECDSDDGEDDLDNFPFFINKSGLPIEKNTWDRMWKFACKLYPDARNEIERISNAEDLERIPPPSLPMLNHQSTIQHRLRQLQGYINALQYNHTGTQFFEIKKNRPIAGLVDTARDIVKEALPIKCLEAVILSIYLTNTLTNVERFPIGFKSMFDGRKYYHIVLGLYYNGKFGAMGISRRKDLMDKPIVFRSLRDLIDDFDSAYSNYGHALKRVRIGGSISHDSCSQERIFWTLLNIPVRKLHISEWQKKIERFTKDLKSQLSYSVMAASSHYNNMTASNVPQRRLATGGMSNDLTRSKKKPVRSASADSAIDKRKAYHSTEKRYQVRV